MRANKIKNIAVILTVGIFIYGMLIMQLVMPEQESSDTERRLLQRRPAISKENILSGKFMEEFEVYTQDQFPFRDTYRGIKAFSSLYLFGQKEIHDLYVENGYYVKVEYPQSSEMLKNATDHFGYIYENYLKDKDVKIYSTIVPDKNYFLGKDSNHPTMDYEKLVRDFCDDTPYMKYIDIMSLLSIEDYYKTDTHWKQERLVPVAKSIGKAMNIPIADLNEYEVKELDGKFYGVYAGQLPIYVSSDKINYMENDVLRECVVTSFDTGKATPSYMYDFNKAVGRDPYELFLSGSDALITIENPNATTDRELVVFRDSFGSSLVPLLLEGYKKMTLVDIRYISSQMIGYFIEFNNQDILFEYSTLLLNSSMSMK